MRDRCSGFTMLEMLIVVLILAIIAAFAIPQAYRAIKAYKLHSDAAAVAKELNVARFRATSQNTPYHVHVDPATNTFYMERLTQTYQPFSPPSIELGTQYLSTGDSFLSANPGSSCPPPAPLPSFSSCPGATDVYFNTRGMPVDTTGAPIPNGGEVIYVQNADGLTDAVTVTVAGMIGVYNWSAVRSNWYAR